MCDIEIIACGGAVYDMTTFISRFPKPGETVPAKRFIEGFGGTTFNQCYMAKQLGAKTAFVGKIGNDSVGAKFKAYFKDNGIHDAHATFTDEDRTSIGNIIVTEKGENCIAHYMGALNHLSTDDVIKASEELFVQDGGQILLCSYECPRGPLFEILSRAKAKKLTTIVNANPWSGEPYQEIYPLVDIICLNETEAELATSLPVQSVSDAESACRFLASEGCQTIVITLGSNGVVLYDKSTDESLHVEAPKVIACDTSGAGDAFIGSFGFFLHRHRDLTMREKLERSCAIAAITVQFEGTQASYPSLQEIPPHLLQS